MKKVWLLFVLCSLMMAVGCSGKFITEDMQAVSMDSSVEDVSVSEVVVEDTGGVFEQNAMEEAHSQEAVSDDEKESELTVEDNTLAEAVSDSKEDAVATEESAALTELGMRIPKRKISHSEYESYEEKTVETVKTEDAIYESYGYGNVTSMEVVDKVCNEASQMLADAEASILEAEEILSDYEIPDNMQETITEIEAEVPAQPEPEEVYHEVSQPVMTKELYLSLTDKEKVEWLSLVDCDVQERIHRFVSKLNSIGIVYKYSADMLDEFMRLEAVAEQKEKEEKQLLKETGRKYSTR